MATEKPYDLHDSTGYWLTRVFRHLDLHFRTLLAERGLSPGLWAVIGAIGSGRGTTPCQAADFVGIDRSAMTRQLDRLEQQGFLRRKPSPDDRRSTLLELTAKGKRAYPRLAQASQLTNEHFLQGVSAAEAAALRATLKKMISNAAAPVRAL